MSRSREVEEIARRHKTRTAEFDPKSENLHESAQARISKHLSVDTTQDALRGYVVRYDPNQWAVPSISAFHTLWTTLRYGLSTTPEQRKEDSISAGKDFLNRQLKKLESLPEKLKKIGRTTVATARGQLQGQEEQTIQMVTDLKENMAVRMAKQVSAGGAIIGALSIFNHPAATLAIWAVRFATVAHMGHTVNEFQKAVGGPEGPIVTAMQKRLDKKE